MDSFPVLGTNRVLKLLVVLAVAVASARGDTPRETPAISIVSSPDTRDVPDTQRATLAFDLAQSALGRPREAHPRIVLMYVNEQTARAQGVSKENDIMVIHIHQSQPSSYFVYLVGEATDERLAVAVVCVLNREWELKLTKRQIDEAAFRVRLGLSGVISARELARQEELRTSR
jgi:hypothetical protein